HGRRRDPRRRQEEQSSQRSCPVHTRLRGFSRFGQSQPAQGRGRQPREGSRADVERCHRRAGERRHEQDFHGDPQRRRSHGHDRRSAGCGHRETVSGSIREPLAALFLIAGAEAKGPGSSMLKTKGKTTMRNSPGFREMLAMALAAVMTLAAAPARAASHREAPLIALDPAADNTDTYAFRSWQDPGKAVFIMNVIPGQDPADGPNYFNFDDEVLYSFNIDNNLDGRAEDIVYEFRFKTENRPLLGQLEFPLAYVGNPSIPVAAAQGITRLDGTGSEGLTRRQTYTVTEVRGKKRTELYKGQRLIAVPSNVGPATMPKYEELASQGIFTDAATGIKVFAGQRAETFYIDLGAVFDTANLR